MDTRNNVHLQTFRHRCFNVAMDFHPWIQDREKSESYIACTFNVAMDFHPWIQVKVFDLFKDPDQPSMLPWIFIHGYHTPYPAMENPNDCLQCCHGFSSMDTRTRGYPGTIPRTFFNVAMDFHPWIPSWLHFLEVTFLLLQCCHGFSSMDTWDIVRLWKHSEWNSSMLPWIFIHGYLIFNTLQGGFNNASMLPWIFIHGYMLIAKVLKRLKACFNVAMDFHPWIPISSPPTGTGDYQASMLPWIFIHGYRIHINKLGSHGKASMLPWIFIHGYLIQTRLKRYGEDPLQCCHGFSSMDTGLNTVIIACV